GAMTPTRATLPPTTSSTPTPPATPSTSATPTSISTTTPPRCTAGGCDDANPCTDDTCDPAVGCQHVPNTASCSDGVECTLGDICSGSVSAGRGRDGRNSEHVDQRRRKRLAE